MLIHRFSLRPRKSQSWPFSICQEFNRFISPQGLINKPTYRVLSVDPDARIETDQVDVADASREVGCVASELQAETRRLLRSQPQAWPGEARAAGLAPTLIQHLTRSLANVRGH